MQWQPEAGPDAVVPGAPRRAGGLPGLPRGAVRRAGRRRRGRRRDPDPRRGRGIDAVSGERPLPSLRATATGTQLIVDGRPVLLLGGQLHNSSPSSPAYMEPIWDRLAGMGIRTVIGAASWAQVEPVEGSFDFSTVDAQIEAGAGPRHAPGADLVRRVQERRVDVRAGVGAPGCRPLSPGGRCRHGQGPVHLSGRDAEAGAHGVLRRPARRRPPGVRPVHGAPGRRRPGPHRGDGPGRERGGPPPRQPRPVARGRGGVARRRAAGR